MNRLETTTATVEFEIFANPRRDTDPQLVDAVTQNNRLRRALHDARDEGPQVLRCGLRGPLVVRVTC